MSLSLISVIMSVFPIAGLTPFNFMFQARLRNEKYRLSQLRAIPRLWNEWNQKKVRSMLSDHVTSYDILSERISQKHSSYVYFDIVDILFVNNFRIFSIWEKIFWKKHIGRVYWNQDLWKHYLKKQEFLHIIFFSWTKCIMKSFVCSNESKVISNIYKTFLNK